MRKIKYLAGAALALVLPVVALAQVTPPSSIPTVGLTKTSIATLITNFANYFAGIVGVLGILAILYAAFKFITAGGSEDAVKSAKQTFIWGLVGIGVAIIAFGVFQLVASFLQ